MKKIIRISCKWLFFLLLPFVIFTLITSKAPIANISSMVVLTGSMQPAIPVGSIVYIQKSNTYKKGDVITFKTIGKETVTHRIVGIQKKDNKTVFLTKGDANHVNDREAVSIENILGKSIFSFPEIGKLIVFLKSPLGFTSLIIFPITVFIVFELWNLKKEIEKHIETKVMKKLQTNA